MKEIINLIEINQEAKLKNATHYMGMKPSGRYRKSNFYIYKHSRAPGYYVKIQNKQGIKYVGYANSIEEARTLRDEYMAKNGIK